MARRWRTRSTRFARYPEYLVVHMRKFELVNWVPKKLGKYYLKNIY